MRGLSGIQPGDLVVGLPAVQCAYGADTHDGYEDILVGAVKRVARIEPTSAYIGGYVIFTDGEELCDGCVRKLNDEPDNAELIERIRACRPMKAPVLASRLSAHSSGGV